MNTKSLFLIDSIGAFISAFMLGFVLVNWEVYFKVPVDSLNTLAILAVLLSLFSLTCYLFVKHNLTLYFKIIASLNLMYCLLTSVYIYTDFTVMTNLGLLYFIGEIAIILILVKTEFRYARQL